MFFFTGLGDFQPGIYNELHVFAILVMVYLIGAKAVLLSAFPALSQINSILITPLVLIRSSYSSLIHT